MLTHKYKTAKVALKTVQVAFEDLTGAVGNSLWVKEWEQLEAQALESVRATFTLALSSAGCNRLGPTAEGTCSLLPDNQQGAILW